MLVGDLFDVYGIKHKDVHTIRTECSQFIQESVGLPVYRALPRSYSDFQRVKVRYQRHSTPVSEIFNAAFDDQYHQIVPRGVFTQSAIMEETDDLEPFYVFPINGYRYVYSKGVQNSQMNFQDVISTLSENVDGGLELTRDLIKYTYTQHNLQEGIVSESEIIFFNIPCFYAVRANAIVRYSRLINT